MRKVLAIISCLFVSAAVCFAQDNTRTKNNKAGIDDNLYEIYQLCSRHRSDSTCIHYSDSLRRLAKIQKDKKAEAMSWAYPLSYYLGQNDGKKMFEVADSLKDASRKIELWSFYYYAITQESIYLLRREEFAEAIDLGEKTMEQAYSEDNKNGIYASHSILANCYLALRLYDEASQEAELAIQAEIGLPDTEFGNGLQKLAESYYDRQEWQKCLDAIAKYESLVDNSRVQVRIAEYKALCYYWMGDMDAYKEWNAEVQKLYQSIGKSSSHVLGIKLDGINLLEQGRVSEAEKIFSNVGRPENLYLLAYLYEKTGNTQKLGQTLDSLSTNWIRMGESIYNTDVRKYDLEVQNRELELKHQAFVIYAIIAILVVLLLFATAMFFTRIRHTKELEKQLEAVRKADSANAAKTAFLFNMSHDIRTPMNAIIGFTNLIEEHYDDKEKCMDYIHKTQDANKFLLSLINNVLEMARIESGNVTLNEERGDANRFIDTLYSLFDEQMSAKGIKFTKAVDVQHRYAMCDAVKIREIFLNIISNAYKYTPAGGSVDVKLEELPSDKEGYALYRTTVSDTGIGMREEFIEHIFETFSRAKTTTESKVEGTGLGMAIVKKYIDMMGGTIDVKSELGKGSTFTVCIQHRIAGNDGLPETDETAAGHDAVDFTGKRILLAEDNDLNAEIAEAILTESGFVMERAKDGAECVRMLQESEDGHYDVILMDIQMPNMNGYEATRTIRSMSEEKKAGIPIIAMTANAFESDIKDAFDAGMDGHVSKPIEIPKLMNVLSETLK